MSVTVDIKMLGFVVLAVVAVILMIYLIVLVRKLLITVDRANKILEDAEVVSGMVSDRSKEVDGIIGDVSDSVGAFAGAVKDKQGVVQATTSVVRAIVSV